MTVSEGHHSADLISFPFNLKWDYACQYRYDFRLIWNGKAVHKSAERVDWDDEPKLFTHVRQMDGNQVPTQHSSCIAEQLSQWACCIIERSYTRRRCSSMSTSTGGQYFTRDNWRHHYTRPCVVSLQHQCSFIIRQRSSWFVSFWSERHSGHLKVYVSGGKETEEAMEEEILSTLNSLVFYSDGFISSVCTTLD